MTPSLLRTALCAIALVASFWGGTPISLAQDSVPYWVKTTREVHLWDGTGPEAKSIGTVPAGTYFAVIGGPQQGKLPVIELTSQRNGFINESDVERGAPPPDPAPARTQPTPSPTAGPTPERAASPTTAPAASGAFSPFWVSNFAPAPLWNGDGEKALPLGIAEPGHWFRVTQPQTGPRLRVKGRLSEAEIYIEAASVGPVGEPTGPPVLGKWWGTVGMDGINVRAEPNTRSRIIGQLTAGTPIVVDAWVEGADVFGDQPGWAQIGQGAYIYGPLLRRIELGAPPPPAEAPTTGKWIDVNLTLQLMTAYEGQTPVRSSVTSSGRPGWETTVGTHRIFWRKEVETMESNRLLAQDAARADYRVENVRYTQYFTNDGQAIHENYWRARELFGIPSSHGCLGLTSEDALWFWEWATTGTPVIVHY